jgi:methionyl-tRNA synthetase
MLLKKLITKQTNKYLQINQPWALAKRTGYGELEQKHVERTIYHAAEAVRIIGILLQPYMPGKATQLLDMIGVDDARRSFEYAQLGADETYGEARAPVGKGAWDGLFPPLSVET